MKTLSAGIKMAVFAAVTLAATGLLAFTIGNVDLRPATTYHAVFADAVNLNPGDDVREAGVRVGSVTGVELYHDNAALVSFRVDSGVPVTTTTTAVIRYRNLIGQRYLALVDGPGGGGTLGPGATIPEARTQPALDLTALFNGFRPLLAGLSPGDVNRLAYELVQVLQGEGGTVDSLFSQLGDLTGTLAGRDAVLGQVISNLDAVLTPVAAHDAQLSALIDNVHGFVSGLAADRQAIGSSLASINELTSATGSLLGAARPSLRDDVAQLGVLAEKLSESQSRALIEHFLTYTPFKLQVATPETSYGGFLNFYVCGVNFILPNGTETPFRINSARRCHA